MTAPVQPGDWFVVDPSAGEPVFRWIELGERIVDGRRAHGMKWGHAGIATRWADGVLLIAEAEPHGAIERPWHWQDAPHLWSAGTGLSVPAMAQPAISYTRASGGHGVPYSFLDYAAIAAHAMHLWAPGLKSYIASTGHMICSQLVDQCAMDCGMRLFDDNRWPGYVTPLDLALLLLAAGAQP